MGLISLCNILEMTQQPACEQQQENHLQCSVRRDRNGRAYEWDISDVHDLQVTTLRLLVRQWYCIICASKSQAVWQARNLTACHSTVYSSIYLLVSLLLLWVDWVTLGLLQFLVYSDATSILHSQHSPPAGTNNIARKSFLFLGKGCAKATAWLPGLLWKISCVNLLFKVHHAHISRDVRWMWCSKLLSNEA